MHHRGMAGLDDVRRIALALPEAEERLSGEGLVGWRVKGRGFAWERPLRRADRAALGDGAPDGTVLGLLVADVGVKEALLQDDPAVFFTTPHFDGYPAVLVRLDEVDAADLREVVVDAWLAVAPKRLAGAFLLAQQQ